MNRLSPVIQFPSALLIDAAAWIILLQSLILEPSFIDLNGFTELFLRHADEPCRGSSVSFQE